MIESNKSKKGLRDNGIFSISEMQKKNIQVQWPLSPDSAFNEIQSKKINCLIGNYHDQVLPTFKY